MNEIKYNTLEKPQTRIALLKLGISEIEIGRAYQTIRGRIVT